MRLKVLVCLALLTSTGFAAAGTPRLVGVNFQEWFADSATQMATDSSGALYTLADYVFPGNNGAQSVTKLSADGTTIVWQNQLGFVVDSMAVSPAGEVFVVPRLQASDTAVYVGKVAAGGSGLAWKTAVGFTPQFFQSFPPVLAADSQGRTYLAAPSSPSGSTVVRINAAGNAVDYSTKVTGMVASIAADGTGAVLVAGLDSANAGRDFVERLASDGAVAYNTLLPGDRSNFPALALDAGGNAVVSDGVGDLWRLNSAGAIAQSTSVPGSGAAFGLDRAGNAYILEQGPLYPVRNSIATCLPSALPIGTSPQVLGAAGAAFILTVVSPDGSIPQITYVPGAAAGPHPYLAVSPDGMLFLAAQPASGFAPTQKGPFPQGPPSTSTVLIQLAPQSAVPTVSLACVGSAAHYALWPVAPGEAVALIGSGLGPQQGVETHGTMQSPFPTQVAGVQVTFDGTPAPLLWVQDSQINAVVPWSLRPGTNTEICVWSGSTRTNCLTWPVTETSPGVYSLDGTHAAAVNEDGSLNSATNPAAVGSIVSVYATGLGPVGPAQADGSLIGLPLPANVIQTAVESLPLVQSPPFGLGYRSVPVPVSYAGPAPFLVAGTSQINFQVTANLQFYLAPGGLNSINLPAASTSQTFRIYVAGQ